MIRVACALLLACLPVMGHAAPCRQALALGLDVSGSVDAREYRLQMAGVAQALDDPAVRDKLLLQPDAPVSLLVFEWSGPQDQAVVVPWTAIDGPAALEGVIATLRSTGRRDATPGTALGIAMQFGADQLAQQPHCWKHTLDISGDGKSNLGPRPRDIKEQLKARDLTINGLVIGVDNPRTGDIRQAEVGQLSSYYRAEVMLGPDAFVHTALGFTDYARAMTQKLLRELEVLIVSERVQ